MQGLDSEESPPVSTFAIMTSSAFRSLSPDRIPSIREKVTTANLSFLSSIMTCTGLQVVNEIVKTTCAHR